MKLKIKMCLICDSVASADDDLCPIDRAFEDAIEDMMRLGWGPDD